MSTESFSSVASTSFSPLTSTSHGHHVNRFDLIDSTYSGHHVSPKYPFTPTSSVLSGTGSSYSAGSSPVFGPSTPTGSSSGQPHYGSDHLCNAMEGMGYAHSMILHSHSPPSHRSQPATSSFVVSPERHYCSSPLSMVHSSDGHYDMHAPSPSTSGMGSAGNLTPVTLSYNAHDGSLIMLEPKVDPLSKTDPLDLEPLKLEPLKLEPYSPGGPSSGMIFSTFTSSSSSGIDSPCTSLVQSNGHQIQNSTGNYNVRISAVQRTSAALHMAQQQQHPQKVSSSGASGSIHTQSPRFSIEINRILQPDPNDEERKEQERQLCRHGSFSSNTISQVNRESSGNKLDQHRRLPKQCKDGDNYGCQSQVQISSRNRTQQAHGDDDGLEEYYTKIGERYWCTWKDGVPCNRLFKRIEHMKRHIKT